MTRALNEFNAAGMKPYPLQPATLHKKGLLNLGISTCQKALSILNKQALLARNDGIGLAEPTWLARYKQRPGLKNRLFHAAALA